MQYLDEKFTEKYIKYMECKFTKNKNIFISINNILNNNIVLTGSTVISAILNNPYFYNEKRNIDLNIIANIHDYHYTELLNILDYNYLIIKKKLFIKPEIMDNNLIDYDIYNIIDSENKSIVKINILHINIIPKEFILSHNNLNLVKNYYNGDRIYTFNYKNLINKYDNLKHIPYNENQYYNIIKYTNRGFKISICNICIQSLYNNDFPVLYKFRNDIATEIIKKYMFNKQKKIQVNIKHRHCIIS
jgi:hypothetical protein